MILRKSVLKSFAGLLIVFVLGVGLLWGMTIRQRDRAEAFLREFTKLELGKSTFADAQQIAAEYHGIPWYTGPDDMRCTPQRCELRFVFENKPLTSFRLARYVELIGVVSVKDGIVAGRELIYASETGNYNPLQYDVVEEPPLQAEGKPQHFQEIGLARLNVDDKGIPSTVRVRLGVTSSPEQRKRAYALDLSCLAKLFGCKNPSAIFPSGIPYSGTAYQTHVSDW